MDASFAAYQARLDSFAGPKAKSRRTSTRSKKAAPKAAQKGGWPLSSPGPEDLAYAGFIFKPTSASPDNVQCFSCQTQLDGWEENDVPAFEHLTHSPTCGFATNVCIRLRNGDPGRAEDDPLSETMMEARGMTFAELWPLDAAAGFPSIEQMVNAGWYYDPSTETPDGVTCAYCSLSLDAWDAGDDPTEEHRKRSSDCLFFTLKELYHPTQQPKATRAKRSSSRSSTASRKGTKPTRTKKAATKEDLNKPLPPAPSKRTTRNKRTSEEADFEEPVLSPKRHRISDFDLSTSRILAESTPPPPRQTKITKPEVFQISELASSRILAESTPPRPRSRRIPKPEAPQISDLASSRILAESIPPPAQASQPSETANSKFLAESVSPSPPRQTIVEPDIPLSPIAPHTPEAAVGDAMDWQPVNVEDFFEKRDLLGIVSNVVVDAGLDDIDVNGAPEMLLEGVKAGLTTAEKSMTIEEWVMYNAKRGEEKLRLECERQIAAFEVEGRRALAAIDAC